MLFVTKGSRTPMAPSFAGPDINLLRESPVGKVRVQMDALLSGASGMILFDAATPLQKRKRNQRVACLCSKQIEGELGIWPKEAGDSRTNYQHFTVCGPCGESDQVQAAAKAAATTLAAAQMQPYCSEWLLVAFFWY